MAAARSSDGTLGADRPPLVIGLVNNMPDAALRTTERQFRDLLGAASGPRRVELRLIALADVPRGAAARAELAERYQGPELVSQGALDGLIVTGTEPRSARLADEPYWAAFEALVEGARRETVSTIWSCLAAHAAVQVLDGIERRRYPEKLFGVFECNACAPHPLTAGFRATRHVPHSRFNDVPEASLCATGYQVLARSDPVGADLFVREGPSLFVFLQGHPEYDRSALMREYRRDVGRYLSGEREHYPRMPQGYFDAQALKRFADFEADALGQRHPERIADFPAIAEAELPEAAWHAEAVRLYANWLALLYERRSAVAPHRAALAAARSRDAGLGAQGIHEARRGS